MHSSAPIGEFVPESRYMSADAFNLVIPGSACDAVRPGMTTIFCQVAGMA
jgi:hypothetical protein